MTSAGKACSRCGVVKPPEAFYRRSGALSSWCRECTRSAARDGKRQEVRPCPVCGSDRVIRSDRPQKPCRSCSAKAAAIRSGRRPPPRARLDPVERERRIERQRERERRLRRLEHRLASIRRERARTWAFVGGWCAGCGAAFVVRWACDAGPMTPRYCSTSCRQRHREKGRARPPISPAMRRRVFERDRWVCRICGRRVARSKVWPHPRSPVVDHVVALANGGAHEEWNMQTAHVECNARKAADGQLALGIEAMGA